MSSHQFLFFRFSSMCKELRVPPVFHLHTARSWCLCGVRCITGSLWREWDVIYVWDRTWRGSGPVVRSYWKTFSNWHPVQGEESFRGRHQQVLLRWKIVDITQTRISLQCNLPFPKLYTPVEKIELLFQPLLSVRGKSKTSSGLLVPLVPALMQGLWVVKVDALEKGHKSKSCWPFSVSSFPRLLQGQRRRPSVGS